MYQAPTYKHLIQTKQTDTSEMAIAFEPTPKFIELVTHITKEHVIIIYKRIKSSKILELQIVSRLSATQKYM